MITIIPMLWIIILAVIIVELATRYRRNVCHAHFMCRMVCLMFKTFVYVHQHRNVTVTQSWSFYPLLDWVIYHKRGTFD